MKIAEKEVKKIRPISKQVKSEIQKGFEALIIRDRKQQGIIK